MKIVIVAKTRMGSGACIGALTFDGRSLRLIAADRETNDRFNMDYQVGEVWEIETRPDPQIIPPHVENVIVTSKRRLGPMMKIEAFIEKQMPPKSGGLEAIFEGLTQCTGRGALYIAEKTGLPPRSTMFWQPDRPLVRDDDHKRIRYRYGDCSLTFVGFQEPLAELPAGAILRVSLAHWWRPSEMPEGELRCYVQLSGWFLDEKQPTPKPVSAPPKRAAKTYQSQIPHIDRVLLQVFGYPSFRPLQRPIIQNVLSKRDSLAVMPTGSGKSLCYQLPATLFPGLTVVVSPLISLMEDQVLELEAWGIPAVYLNSTLTHEQYVDAVGRIRAGEVRLLYAAPETLLRPETFVLLENCKVDCLVIDEAHCISEWGHEFRPEYRQLAGLRDRLPGAATLAVTATATKRVRQDIKTSLGIRDANEFVSSFDRENLVLGVVDKMDGFAQTRAFLDSHKDQAGIIYCSTRDHVDTLAEDLRALGYPALPYHAGMEDRVRRAHQHRFRYEDGIIMVATIAFGMGINKSNVRFILHYNLPKNLESYYQQIGRAGRDGLRADCLVLFSYGDVSMIRYFIDQEDPKLRPSSEHRLQTLLAFLESRECRRKPLLSYFGETVETESCDACDICTDRQDADAITESDEDASAERVDLTAQAQKFLKCVQETGQIFGMMHIIDVLRGSRARKILRSKHDQLSTYGTGEEYSKVQWRHLASQFIRQGLVKRDQPHGSLVITEEGKAVLSGQEFAGQLPGTLFKTSLPPEEQEYDLDLFERLRNLRASLAEERGVPPYVIFHDRSLIEMARFFPRTPDEMAQIYGVGQRKLEEYAAHFLPVIQAYCQEKDIRPAPQTLNAPRRLKTAAGRKRGDQVWTLFQAGHSLAEIGEEIGIKPSTVLNHLRWAFEAGRALTVENLRRESDLPPEIEERVIRAFREFGTYRLRPVYESLDETVTWEQLHLWRLIHRAMEAGQGE